MTSRLRTRLRAHPSQAVPSLNLEFATASGGLDPRITFSRGSNATVVDSTGRVTYAPANMLTWSEQFDNAAWVKNATGTLLRNETDPLGVVNSATTLVADNAGGVAQVYAQQSFSTQAGVTYAMSVYLKQGTQRYAAINIFTGFSNTALWFDLQAGTSGVISGSGATTAISSIGSGWYRCTVVSTATTTLGNATFRIAVADDTTDINYLTPRNGTSSILIWGAQLEQVTYQTTPSAYVATTSAAYYGPRFDYDPVTLAPRGLLIEEARTNLLTYSQQFDNASWTATNATVSPNTTTAPDGTLSADTLVEDTTAGVTHRVFATPSCSPNTTYTYTAYIKAAGRTQVRLLETTLGGAIFDLSTATVVSTDAGITSAIENAGNGWYRCRISATTGVAQALFVTQIQGSVAGNPTYTGSGAAALYLWGAQLELGSFATSYIPTVASTVTRSADVATMTGTNFSSWYNPAEGAFVVSGTSVTVGNDAKFLSITDGTASGQNNCLAMDLSSGKTRFLVFASGVSQCAFTSTATYTSGSVVKIAGAYKQNDFGGTTNGEAITTDTTGNVPSVSVMEIGYHRYGSPLQWINGHIRSIQFYNTRLPDATLQSLTA